MTCPKRAVIVAAWLAVVMASAAPRADRQSAPFKSAVDVVRLDVSVLDENGQPVRGLTADDFTVIEDGKVMPIVAFDAVDIASTNRSGAAWLRDVPRDVISNRAAARRVIVVILDDFNVPAEPWSVEATRRIARDVVSGMEPGDLTAVVYTFNRRSGQEFSADRSRLLAAVDRFVGIGRFATFDRQLSSSYSASERSSRVSPSLGGNTPSGACQRGDCVLMALSNAASILRGAPEGRKTIVLVSPGVERLGQGDEIHGPLAAMIRAMQEANVNVYQFDPRGLQVSAPPGLVDDLDSLATLTGGRVVYGTNAPWDGVAQMLRENGSYYLLGIRPAAASGDRRFHRVTVKVSRPDVEVRGRSGYTLLTEDEDDGRGVAPIDAAIERGMPTGDLSVDLALAPIAALDAREPGVSVVAGVRPSTNPWTFRVVVQAFRDDWSRAATLTRELQSAGNDGLLHDGRVDIPNQLDLRPGRYEIRLAVEDLVSGKVGSVYGSVTVPDITREPLTISGPVLAIRGGTTGTALPTTGREFGPDDQVESRVRLYQGGKRPPLPVQVAVTIVDDGDRRVFGQELTIEPRAFPNRRADLRLELPLKDLRPGDYLLVFDARGAGSRATREVRFAVK